MRSVKLTIDGSYWDSQIYSGELLLFGMNGEVHRIEWREVVDGMAEKSPSIQTAIRVAFSDSDLFYNPKVRRILCDPHIDQPIKLQLSKLAELTMVQVREDWKNHWRTEATPFNFLPTDTDIYYNQIFAAGNEGLFSAPRSGVGLGRPFGGRMTKHHDAGILQVRASDRFTALAVAAGNDGLLEFSFQRGEDNVLNSERYLAKRPCSSCDWAFQSVMGWTANNAFLASFRNEKDSSTQKNVRTFDRLVETREIFGGDLSCNGFAWGCREKFYRISGNGIEVSDYWPLPLPKTKGRNSKKVPHEMFSKRESFTVDFDAANAIATGTAPFGVVLEFDDHLIVLRSDGVVDKFVGEPVHWRIFPRSEHYGNQLHIVYEDRLDIVSFVHDYFVDQTEKLSGFKRGGGEYVPSE